MECWREDVLHLLASKLGKRVGSSQHTQFKKVMTFARFCVEIDLSKPLPDSLEVSAGDYSWVQQLDYETLPFRCFCHEYGHLRRRCPKAKPLEAQSPLPSNNTPSVDKGKDTFQGFGGREDGFTTVRGRNRNKGHKRSLKDRQEEDTFNRFEVLEELSQQEVNPGFLDLDHGTLDIDQHGPSVEEMITSQQEGVVGVQCLEEYMNDPGQEKLNSEVLMAPHGDGPSDIGTFQQLGVQVASGGSAEAGHGCANKAHFLQKANLEAGKKISKLSSQLGILQKDLKKGGSEKTSKLGRKKDVEKIKMIGETLVESGSVKTLDSHFSSPLK